MLDYIRILFEDEPLAKGHRAYPADFETYKKVEKGHGRTEERRITVSSMLDEEYLAWLGVSQVFKLEKWVRRGNKEESREVRFGLTSLPRANSRCRTLV